MSTAATPLKNQAIVKAIYIILAGDVMLARNLQSARVRSQMDGTTFYHVTQGSCNCQGFQKWGHCKHNLAFRMTTKAIVAAYESTKIDSIVQSLGVTVSQDILSGLRAVADKGVLFTERFPRQKKEKTA